MHSSPKNSWHELERRKRSRECVRWTVYALGPGSLHPIRGTTVNLSPCGFYGTIREAFTPGDQLKVRIVMVSPADNRQQDNAPCLDCYATVMRVEAIDNKVFGMAFSIDDYTVDRVEKKTFAVGG